METEKKRQWNKKTQFSKEYQPAPEKKRVKKRKTIIREKLGIARIEDLTPSVLKVWDDISKYNRPADKKFYAKEISPYLFTKKQQTDFNVKGEIKLIVNGIEKL
jgi:hypothetical protein